MARRVQTDLCPNCYMEIKKKVCVGCKAKFGFCASAGYSKKEKPKSAIPSLSKKERNHILSIQTENKVYGWDRR